MTPSAPPSFEARVQTALPTLHPSERRLADVILNVPGQVASYSATELAQIAQVSNATVTRFVRKIGFASFEEARQAARLDQHGDAALARVGAGEVPDDGFAARHLMQSMRNLERTFAGISDAEVDSLARAMLAAPRVFVLGFRAGQPFARYLGWQVLQVIPNVTVVPRDGETLAEVLSAAQPEDCIILFSLRRSSRAMVGLKSLLAAGDIPLACIGDTAKADDLRAKWYFDCKTTASGPLFDHVAIMGLCNLIASRVLELSGDAGRARMQRIESYHDSLDEL